MTGWQLFAAAVAGAGGGLLSGFFGVGGNVVLIPLLGLMLGLPQLDAQGLTLAALLPPVGAPAVWRYLKAGIKPLWALAGVCAIGFVLGVPLGALAAKALDVALLRALFAVLLLGLALQLWRRRRDAENDAVIDALPPRWWPVALAAGFGAGFSSGLLGIGGAIVLIPLLRRALGLGQKQAQLTSLLMMLPPVALPGVIVYAKHSAFSWGVVAPVAVGFLAGAFAGAELTRVVPAARMTRGFALLLVTAAVGLLIRAVG
jgi:uncharacterized membrane protein YfcA